MERVTSMIVLLVLALIVREYRIGNQIAHDDPSSALGRGERFRTPTMQLLEPVVALVIVGTLLVSDLAEQPAHLVAAFVGGAGGVVFGIYRARSTFVASVPARSGVILRTTMESLVAIAGLIVIKVLVEADLLPDSGIFPIVVAGLVAFLVPESCAWVWKIMRWYGRDASALSAKSS